MLAAHECYALFSNLIDVSQLTRISSTAENKQAAGLLCTGSAASPDSTQKQLAWSSLETAPLLSGRQLPPALPSAQLHHQVEDLPGQHRPKMRSLSKPLTPQAHTSLQKGLQSWADPVQPIHAGTTDIQKPNLAAIATAKLHTTICTGK